MSAASRIVHAIASSQPPPSANPLMAAMTGFPIRSMRSNTCWPRDACARAPAGVMTASSLMSAPATNDFSPAPVSTTTRTASSCWRSRIAACSSSSVCAFNALRTLGRLIVSVATAPLRSTAGSLDSFFLSEGVAPRTPYTRSRACRGGTERESSPIRAPPRRREPPNIIAPVRSCSRRWSFSSVANTIDTSSA